MMCNKFNGNVYVTLHETRTIDILVVFFWKRSSFVAEQLQRLLICFLSIFESVIFDLTSTVNCYLLVEKAHLTRS